MAADNRNFVNKFANEGGGDVLVEDKRLEELKSATAKTSSQISTSADYIPLQDTDGNLVKINAASFQEAVRNTLGSLLANNDKGTTVSGIPALSGSGAGLDFGSVTPANLASVLGVSKYTLNDRVNNDLNDCIAEGFYFAFTNDLLNCPITTTNTPVIIEVNQDKLGWSVFQTIKAPDGRVYTRGKNLVNGSPWSLWTRSDNYGTSSLSELATALGASGINNMRIIPVTNITIPANGTYEISDVDNGLYFIRECFTNGFSSFGMYHYTYGVNVISENGATSISASNTSALVFISVSNQTMILTNNTDSDKIVTGFVVRCEKTA